MTNLSKAEKVVGTLERKGFKWEYYSQEFGFTTLSKRMRGGMIAQVEVDADGLCNGLTVDDYLADA